MIVESKGVGAQEKGKSDSEMQGQGRHGEIWKRTAKKLTR